VIGSPNASTTEAVSVVVPGIVQTPFAKVPGDTVQERKASAGAAEIVWLPATDPQQTAVATAAMARILKSITPSIADPPRPSPKAGRDH